MIELRQVSKTVRSGSEPLTILHPLDLSIATGGFWSLTGPSGSGKSTLLGLVAGLDSPTTGSISVDSRELGTMNEDELAVLRRDRIGFVFQFFHLIPTLSALENVLVPMELSGRLNARQRASRLLADLGLLEREHHYPSQLSGGEQQRVALARALANEPLILLADEPTGNLDDVSARAIADLIVQIHRDHGTTVLMATHDPELAERADNRLMLRGGRAEEIRSASESSQPLDAEAAGVASHRAD